MDCKCKNGKDELDFLLPGTTEGTYVIGLTHNSCGNRQMLLADPTHPVICELTATAVGTPVSVGNSEYCQECQIAGTVTYRPCNSCSPRVEYVSKRICLPCSAATSPTLTIGTVAASPKPITQYISTGGCGCCQSIKPCTNQIAITTSINVATA